MSVYISAKTNQLVDEDFSLKRGGEIGMLCLGVIPKGCSMSDGLRQKTMQGVWWSSIDSRFSAALIRKPNCTESDNATVFYYNLDAGLFSSLLIGKLYTQANLGNISAIPLPISGGSLVMNYLRKFIKGVP